jgi:hypothetical protein
MHLSTLVVFAAVIMVTFERPGLATVIGGIGVLLFTRGM